MVRSGTEWDTLFDIVGVSQQAPDTSIIGALWRAPDLVERPHFLYAITKIEPRGRNNG
jgi:hypothetical protein